jgi:hypothetical protein
MYEVHNSDCTVLLSLMLSAQEPPKVSIQGFAYIDKNRMACMTKMKKAFPVLLYPIRK